MLLAKIALTAAATALYGARHAGATPYSVTDKWTSANFFHGFTYYSGPDPSVFNGWVSYVNKTTAKSLNLTNIDSSDRTVHIGADAQHVPQGGVKSVRLQSKKTYTKGLFVIDLKHMPFGQCTFPTFGTSDANGGAIDILTGINDNLGAVVAARTSSECNMMINGNEGPYNCQDNSLCRKGSVEPYGQALNKNGGGVYAMEWNDTAIQVWSFKPGSTQAHALTRKKVDTSEFGEPFVSLTPDLTRGSKGCKISDHFNTHNIIIDLNFCGSWASSGFDAFTDSCEDTAETSYWKFSDAYWAINAVRVYSANGAA